MNRPIQSTIDDLKTFQFDQSAPAKLELLAEEIESNSEGKVAVSAVLRLFERFPNEEFGVPGPLAHAVERFYGDGYEEELLASLRRAPTPLTVWLAHRIVNAGNADQLRFIDQLREIADNETIDELTRAEARRFTERW